MTTVRDTVYKSDGSLASGTVVITWRPFVTADSKPVFGGTKTVPLSSGALAVALVPNVGGTPSGTSYNVKYYQSGNVFSEETWVVPSSSVLPSPGTPTVSNAGTPGSTTYHYWVSAKNTNGETLLGPSGVTTTSNSTLDGTNYNQISWSADSGAASYRVWRTATSTAPSGTGNYLVGETAATSINDQSNSLQQAAVPSINDTDPRTLADVRVTAAPSSTVTLAASQVNGTAIVSNPSATQTINAPPKAGVIPLQIKGDANDGANVLEIYDSQSQPALQSWFDSGGAFLTAKSDTGAGNLYGIRSNISSSNSSGARTLASAMESKATHNAAGTLTEMVGFLARTNVRSAGTVTNNYGLRVESQQRVSATAAKNWDLYVGNPRSDFNATSQVYIDTAGSIFTMKKSSSDGGAKLVGLTAVAEDTTTDSQIVGMEAHAEIAHSSGNKGFSLGSYADARSSGGGNSDLIAGGAFWAEQAGTGTIADMASLWIIGNARYAGTVNNSYGILVSDVAGIGTNSWAIKTGTGKVQFGDAVLAPTINNVRYASQFPGANAGAKIAAAIAALPSTGGTVDAKGLEGTQTISSNIFSGVTKSVTLLLGAATYDISTPQVIGSLVLIQGANSQTTLNYTGTGIAFTFDYPVNTAHPVSPGMRDCILAGPGTGTSTTGIKLGANGALNTTGAEGAVVKDTRITNFGTGVTWGNNTWRTSFENSFVGMNGAQVLFPSGLTNSGESLSFINTIFHGIGGGANPANGVQFQDGTASFVGGSVDDAQVSLSNAGIYNFYGVHFENPGGNSDVPFLVNDNTAVSCFGCQFTQDDATPTMTEAIKNIDGTLLLVGTSASSSGTVARLVNAVDGKVQMYGTRYFVGYTNEYAITGSATAHGILWDGTQLPFTVPLGMQINNSTGLSGSTSGALTIYGADGVPTIRSGQIRNTNGTTFGLTDTAGDFWASFNLSVGSIALSAKGTNQSITLSPVGTGIVDINGAIRSTMTTVTFSTTPTFDASLGNSFKITLTNNVTSSTLSNTRAGQQISFLICEDGTGGRTFAWPANVKGGMTITTTLNTCNAQSFIYDGTNAYATSAGQGGM